VEYQVTMFVYWLAKTNKNQRNRYSILDFFWIKPRLKIRKHAYRNRNTCKYTWVYKTVRSARRKWNSEACLLQQPQCVKKKGYFRWEW